MPAVFSLFSLAKGVKVIFIKLDHPFATWKSQWSLYDTNTTQCTYSPGKCLKSTLGGGFNPFEKILVKLDHFPNFRGEIIKNVWVAASNLPIHLLCLISSLLKKHHQIGTSMASIFSWHFSTMVPTPSALAAKLISLKSLRNLRDKSCFMGVSKNRGIFPPKWVVKIMENPMKMDDLGVPLFLETSIYRAHTI